MSFITLSQAKAHLRIDGSASDSDLLIKIEAAERSAVEYLGCNVYDDETSMAAAIAAVTATLAAAKATYNAAYEVAIAIEDADLSLIEEAQAMAVYMRAVYAATRTRNGVVINDLIIAAMLLIVGWLFEQREDTDAVPRAAQDLLNQFRCYA